MQQAKMQSDCGDIFSTVESCQTVKRTNSMVKHASKMLRYHPLYQQAFEKTQNFILRGDGPLSAQYCCIIGIMAAGRHENCCLMHHLRNHFLKIGGDASWLDGLSAIPKKLQKFYELNMILAHKPWRIEQEDFQRLTRGEDSWSLSEVIHGIILLVHFHSLTTYFYGCEINESLRRNRNNCCEMENHLASSRSPSRLSLRFSDDEESSSSLGTSPDRSPDRDTDLENELMHSSVEIIDKEIRRKLSTPDNIPPDQLVKLEDLRKRMEQLRRSSADSDELAERFLKIKEQSCELLIAPKQENLLLNTDIGLFIDKPDFTYEDFFCERNCKESPTFRVQDYSWEEQGSSLVYSLASAELGSLLSDKFKIAQTMTYRTLGKHKNVDTTSLREAIWNYAQCLFGIRYDDYDYNVVNQLLERDLKAFIKTAVCYPERLSSDVYTIVMQNLHESEKIHVLVMLMEARMQAELLYALRALKQFMT